MLAVGGVVAVGLIAGGLGLFLALRGPGPGGKGGAGDGPTRKDGAGTTSAYDDGLTRYLPESANRIDVLDAQGARSNAHLSAVLKQLLKEGSFGSWDHKEQGIGVLKRAGIPEDAVKSLTLARTPESREPVVFTRFAAAPDQEKFVQGLKATASQQQGKTYHAVKDLSSTPLYHVHFLEPTLFVFARDPKRIAPFTQARTTPAASPDLLRAIKLTRGPRATAAHVARGWADTGISPRVADVFWVFTRAPGSFFELSGKARGLAYWYTPAGGGLRAHFACLFPDGAAAAAAEVRANELLKSIRQAYQTDRAATDPALRGAVLNMFDNVACTRDGTTVTLTWPLAAELVQRFMAPR
jgi:hypothetical protein